MLKSTVFALLFLMTFCFFSCQKDKQIEPFTPQAPKQTSTVIFDFKALADNLPLIKNSKWYKNAFGDSFTVSKFNYYISNIKFKRADGAIYAEPESYHIIKHIEGVTSFAIPNFPEGKFTEVEFLIGVDSLRNVSGAQTGALSPDTLMFWEWNSGYIFFKLEGQFKTTLSPIPNNFAMHIGGFKGPFNCLQKCSFSLPNNLTTTQNKSSKIFYNVSINEIFINPKIIDFDTYGIIAPGQKSLDISNNYKDMFSIDHIEN